MKSVRFSVLFRLETVKIVLVNPHTPLNHRLPRFRQTADIAGPAAEKTAAGTGQKRGSDMHRGIITVTLSPSIDVTLWLDGLRTDEANRVTDESRGVGGKGINVSRVVQSYGLDNLCLAVAGKDNHAEFCRYLEKDGLRYEVLQVEGVVRENLTLRYEEQTIKLNRKGLSMSTMMVGALMALIQSRMKPGDIVAFGGSLPENITPQDYLELILAVKNAGALVAVDTDLFTLEQYRRISPWLIKPNIHELRHVVEVPGTTITDVVSAARRLADAGVENVPGRKRAGLRQPGYRGRPGGDHSRHGAQGGGEIHGGRRRQHAGGVYRRLCQGQEPAGMLSAGGSLRHGQCHEGRYRRGRQGIRRRFAAPDPGGGHGLGKR